MSSSSVKYLVIAIYSIDISVSLYGKGEVVIEDALVNNLTRKGVSVKQQVCCANGRADVVTDDAIYEIKAFLTRRCIQEAIGQLFTYRVNINPSARLFIVGCKPEGKHKQKIEVDLAKSLGIEVIVWSWNKQELPA